MKILWLPSWYPSRIEPFNGDFVQRHAEAVSLYHDVDVMYVMKDPTGAVTKDVYVEAKQSGKLNERTIYYRNRFEKIPLLRRLFSYFNYRQIFRKQLCAYIKKNGKPDLVHVHVSLKTGGIARWLKRKYGLKYIVTEHASVFLPEAMHTLEKLPLHRKASSLKTFKSAAAITAVSNHLAKSIQSFSEVENVVRIPNVVNTNIFTLKRSSSSKPCRFLHVSGLGEEKNFGTILSAFSLLRQTRKDFILDVFGPQREAMKQQTVNAGLNDHVTFHHEVPQNQLAVFMQAADALILFSHYETFGCVVIEANACGTPAIVSNLPAMREIVDNGVNGVLVSKDADSLCQVLQLFVDRQISFDANAIAKSAVEKYSYATVGAAFGELYHTVLKENNSKDRSGEE